MEKKNIIFLDQHEKPYFNYILPKSIEKLKEDQKQFSEKYAEKLNMFN